MPVAKSTVFSPNSENSTTSMKTALRILLTPTTGASHTTAQAENPAGPSTSNAAGKMDSSARMPKKRMQICSSEGPQTSFRRIEL
jgi:hypothetical protein